MDPADFCRDVETYLCQRNEGHLVRISGPAFEMVCAWATNGIPLKVAFQGIDRYLQRVEHKGPRRRPVRIEFCEADVLDAFDAWRRAVGVRLSGTGGDAAEGGVELAPRRRPTLAAHIERAVSRLTALRTGPSVSSEWDATLDRIVRRLDALYSAAKSARGQARDAIVTELLELDAQLIDASRRTLDADSTDSIAREADLELAPFAGRMQADAYQDARLRCIDRILRERLALPSLSIE